MNRFIGSLLIVPFLIFGQSIEKLSAEQKEVWETVEQYSKASKDRDLELYLSYWHPEFVGWHNGDDETTDKAERRNALKWYFTNSEVVESKLILKALQVHGSTAVVHLVIDQKLKWSDGRMSSGPSYWTDILVKENGKWLLYSDHGGDVSKKDS